MIVLVARSCSDCNEMAVSVHSSSPSEADEETLRNSVGGMYCIDVVRFEVPDFAVPSEKKDQHE